MTTEISYAIDTFYFLMSGALVMLMALGFTMLESGLVRAKHTVEILTKNVALYSIACFMYLLCGYAIMYGDGLSNIVPDIGTLIGDEHTALSDDNYYSSRSDFFFQVVFVATAMSIISGVIAERMKLWSFLLFAVIMTGFIYPVQGYWSWGGGLLSEIGYSDFAGSGIVHLCGAAAALSGALILGPRIGKYNPDGTSNAIPGANLPLAALGALILWFGWFGFNGGSQLKLSSFEDANAVAQIFVNTNAAAATGVIASLLMSKFIFKKADLTMILNGALAGLVAITADPVSPSPLVASIIGALGGIICVISIVLIDKFLRIDDVCGALSVHGVVGIFGVLMVAVVNSEATFMNQLTGIAAIFGWTFITSFIAWFIIDKIFGLRVSEGDERLGVDVAECGLSAYNLEPK